MTAPVPAHILDEAADWLVQLHSGAMADAEREACERWRRQSTEHARAWARAERLMDQLGTLPPALAAPVLERAPERSRRAMLGKLGMLAAAAPAAWIGWGLAQERGWVAEHRSATGERRELQLADGSEVTLNTASAIDVRFSSSERLVLLRAGEVLVHSAADHRPFRLAGAHGTVEAPLARFAVRQDAERTRVAVLEGAVKVEPASAAATVLRAGEQTWMSRDAVAAPAQADAALAWTRGMLLADRMPLAELTAELARYRRGVIDCDAALAEMRVSGAFPVGGPAAVERALSMLASTYPLTVHKRLGGLWIALETKKTGAA